MDTSEDSVNYSLSWNISTEANISVDLSAEFANMQAQCELYTFIVNGILMGLLGLLGIIGNIISYIVFWKDKVKTSTSFLFQGLSFIDTCLLITCIPLYVVSTLVLYGGWQEGYRDVHAVVLVFIYPLAMLFQTTTIWVTVLVGLNRYIAVCKPYQASRLCTVPQARKQLAIVVVITIIYNLPRFFEAKLVLETDGLNNTHLAPNYTALGENKYYLIAYNNILYMIFLLILPLLILTILNILLINALNEIRRRRAVMQSLRQQQDNNVTLVLIVVVLVFIICQAPALFNLILWNVRPNSDRECGGFQFYFSRVSNFLVMLNSSVNFIIYFCFNTKFRQIFLQWICRARYQKVRTSSTTANHYKTEVTKYERTCIDNVDNHNGPVDGTNGTQQTSLL